MFLSEIMNKHILFLSMGEKLPIDWRLIIFAGKGLVPEQANQMEEDGQHFKRRSCDDHEEQAGWEESADGR